MLVDRICVLSIGHLLAPTLANCALFLTLHMSISFKLVLHLEVSRSRIVATYILVICSHGSSQSQES
jgi:hypothetical protein